MDLHTRAIVYGFLTTVVLALLSGAVIPFTDVNLPVVGTGLTAIVGGFVAGYVAGGRVGNGAVNGGVATVIGAFVALVLLSLFGLLAGGLLGVGIFVAGVVYLALAAIPGALGGAVGAWAKGRSERRMTGRPAT
ncbi:DUF5518 domain-containing protein [Halomarina ordinaria]|uniref:DUF5518 domain-containing protein n=1 Tax=Halomarina ordinaria TaxID=3033939 RepID=A0ABD5UBI0_9EURY|nr:DUF5518 domain-containing protein [Halomarina sp. PSRA2]